MGFFFTRLRMVGEGILAEALASADIENGDGEEQSGSGDENQVKHLARMVGRRR
jgi:hypothetical protein